MTQINITEFRKNIKYYAQLAQNEELAIVSHDKFCFVHKVLCKKGAAIKELKGVCVSEKDYKEILKNRILEI